MLHPNTESVYFCIRKISEKEKEMNATANTYTYNVVPENIDSLGRITVPALCGHMVNAIGQNIRVEGFGIDVMSKINRSWVLVRSAFEIDYRPRLYSPITVSVWPVSKGGITYYRCLRLQTEQGMEIGRGTTEWCMMDILSRRPVTPDEDFHRFGSGFSLPCESPKRIRDFSPQRVDHRMVGYSECDFNGHLNNTRYVEMLYDLLPDEMAAAWSPVRIDINYRKEVKKGAQLSLGLSKETDAEYLFIATSEGQTLCSARVTST